MAAEGVTPIVNGQRAKAILAEFPAGSAKAIA